MSILPVNVSFCWIEVGTSVIDIVIGSVVTDDRVHCHFARIDECDVAKIIRLRIKTQYMKQVHAYVKLESDIK